MAPAGLWVGDVDTSSSTARAPRFPLRPDLHRVTQAVRSHARDPGGKNEAMDVCEADLGSWRFLVVISVDDPA